MKKPFFLVCISLLTIYAVAQPNKLVFNTQVEGVKQYTLPSNGLKVLLIPDNSSSNITVNIVYEVGSRHEGYGESGMAHLLEHMLFRSCKNFTDIKKAIADKGAMANGTTWYDRTNYYEILPATDSNLSWAIAMEADRMVNAKILQSELDAEFSVVRNEFEIGENRPDRVLSQRIQNMMYLWHNYGKSTIGSKEDIERVSADRLRVFYKKFYQPDNATIIIAGKFDEAKAKEYIETQFSVIPKPTRVLEPTYTVEPAQDGIRYVELRRNGDIQYIGFAYHTPSMSSSDYAANDAAIEVLTNNPSGILYKKLIETKIASAVGGYSLTNRDPGFTYFQLDVPVNSDLDIAEKSLFEILNSIDSIKITQEEVDRAKNSLLKYWDGVTDNTQKLAISFTEMIGAGDWRLWYIYRDQVEKLTVDNVQNTLNKYYKTSNLTWGKFIPEKTPDRVSIPESGNLDVLVSNYKGKYESKKMVEFAANLDTIIAKTNYLKTTNGAKYAILIKPTKNDIVNISIKMNLGTESTLQNTALINEVLVELLKEGTKTKSKAAINDAFDKLKSEVNLSGGINNVNITVKTSKDSYAETMKIIGDILQNPKLSEADFQKIIGQKIAENEEYMNDPRQVAFNTLDKVSKKYPQGHPYYITDAKEDIEILKNLKLSDLTSFYSKFYGGNNVVATFVGAANTAEIKKSMQDIFGKWTAKSTYAPIEKKYFDINGNTTTIQISDKTNATCAGNVLLPVSTKHVDYPAIYMANQLLGGGAFMASRITQRLREKEGLSYGAGSYLRTEDLYNTAEWGVYAFFNPIFKGKLDSALHEEINKAVESGFTQEEFEKSRAAWLQGEQTRLGIDNTLAALVNDYLDKNKPLKDKKEFQDKVKALTLNQVNDAVKKYFDVKKLSLIYAGDFNK